MQICASFCLCFIHYCLVYSSLVLPSSTSKIKRDILLKMLKIAMCVLINLATGVVQ